MLVPLPDYAAAPGAVPDGPVGGLNTQTEQKLSKCLRKAPFPNLGLGFVNQAKSRTNFGLVLCPSVIIMLLHNSEIVVLVFVVL